MRIITGNRICAYKGTKIMLKIGVVICFCLSMGGKAYAQYYPYPQPVNGSEETSLLTGLKEKQTVKGRIESLLALSNLYYNKTVKNDQNFNKGLYYAQQAKKLCDSVHDVAAFNQAQLQIAYILIEKDDFKGAKNILPTLNDTTRENLLLTLSFKYYNRNAGQDNINEDSAMFFARNAQILATKLHQQLNEITCLKYIGMIHEVQGKLPLAEKELSEALARYQSFGYKKLQYPYLELTLVYMRKGDFDKALANALQMLHYMNVTKDSTDAGDFYVVFSRILKHDGQKQKALLYAQKAYEQYTQKTGYGYIPLSGTVNEVVLNLLSVHQYQQALSFLLQNLKKYPAANFTEKASVRGDIGDCYLKLKQYDKAETYFLEEFNILKATNSLSESAYHRMGYFYVECKKYSKAAPYLLAAQKLEGTTSIKAKNHLHYMLFLADSAAGNYIPAIRNLSLTKKYDDTIYKKDKVAEMQRLMVQFDIKNKNDQITLLNQKELLQLANVKKADELRNITVVGILILVIAGCILYRQYVQKQHISALVAQKNKQLEKLLIEKEWLLKEIHHRVKNNLHTVISLLEIQAEFLQDDALRAIETSQHRIYAMSLLHQKLYLSEDVKTVDVADYLPELIAYLKESFDSYHFIDYKLDIEPVQLDVSQAMPLGLIINEAVSNAIKYAFTGKKDNIISIKVHRTSNEVILKIADNGTGFNMEAENAKPGSLGLKLIRGLSEDINATVQFENKKGTHITITFSPVVLSSNPDNQVLK